MTVCQFGDRFLHNIHESVYRLTISVDPYTFNYEYQWWLENQSQFLTVSDKTETV